MRNHRPGPNGIVASASVGCTCRAVTVFAKVLPITGSHEARSRCAPVRPNPIGTSMAQFVYIEGPTLLVPFNWLRVSTGVGGGCYDGIEMMWERSAICCIAQ
jgi:hypothetical protein